MHRLNAAAKSIVLLAAVALLAFGFHAGSATATVTINTPTDYVIEPGPEVGDAYYTDRSYTLTSMPSSLTDVSNYTYYMIMTENDARDITAGDVHIEMSLSTAAAVYVAYDAGRAFVLPTWLTDNYTQTSDTIGTTDTTLTLFKKDFAAGTVTLNGNDRQNFGGSSNYIVFVAEAGGSVPAVAIDYPSDYAKVENPSTGIEYYMDRTYTISSLPAALTNTVQYNYTLIKTRNDNKNITAGTRHIDLNITQPATVYVAYDMRGSGPLPTWLSSGFTQTSDTVGTTDVALTLFQKDVSAGVLALNGNDTGLRGNSSNYIVFLAVPTGPAPLNVDPTGMTLGAAGSGSETGSALIYGGVPPYSVDSVLPAGIADAAVNSSTLTVTSTDDGVPPATAVVTLSDSDSPAGTVTVNVTVDSTMSISPAYTPSAGGNPMNMKTREAVAAAITGGVAPYTAVSSDPTIAAAAIDGNSVTVVGTGSGTAAIAITDSGGVVQTLSFDAVVDNALIVQPTTISINEGALGTAQIIGGAAPFTFSVTSSDPAIATVVLSDEDFDLAGVTETVNITGVSEGTATITVSDSLNSADITVEVAGALRVTPGILETTVGDVDTVTITGGSGSYTATSQNLSVATVTMPTATTLEVTSMANGTVSITVVDTANLNNIGTVIVYVGAVVSTGLGTCPEAPFVETVQPNILLILDHSGSMGSGGGSKWDTAKTVLKSIISDFSEVRFGLMRMDGSDYSGNDKWYAGDKVVRQGGKVLKPCGTPGEEIKSYITNWGANSNVPQTWTNLGETLASAGQYFATVVEGGVRVGKGPTSFGVYEKNYSYDIGGTLYDATYTDDKGNYIDTTSPIQYYCQASFIIFITDGLANYDNDWTPVADVIGDYDADSQGGDCKYGDAGCSSQGQYFNDVAKWLYDHDMRSDLSGDQNIATYVIGFQVDDPLLSTAAEQGGGEYYTASSADQLTAALKGAVIDILDRTASGTAVSTISTSSQTADLLIRAKFLSVTWKGFLEAFALPFDESNPALWEAGDILKTNVNRHIYTHMSSETTRKQEFIKTNSALITYLSSEWSEGTSETEDIVDFVAGETTYEGIKYRDRDGWILGDIIYSTPLTVGPPKFHFTENDYQTFREDNSSRPTVVYVGANDGMLHAFRARDDSAADCSGLDAGSASCGGTELWAFVPENVLSSIHHLTHETCHRYYVDLEPVAYDIYDGAAWKTILIGGNRLGGDEYFLLDITDPAYDQFSIIWDFIPFAGRKSSTVPVVGKVKGGAVDKWVTIIASGYDESSNPGKIAAFNFVDTTRETIWFDGVSNVDILTTQARAVDAPYYTMSDPAAVDADLDGYLDLIYVGDTEGTLWKFYYDYADNIWKKVAFFSTGGQPITARPALVFDDADRLRIYFGTGKYLTGDDKTNDLRNAFYCLIENSVSTGDANDGKFTSTTAIVKASDLVDLTSSVTFSDLESLLPEEKTNMADHGWYFNLDPPSSPAERVVQEAVVVAGVVFFTSFVPNTDVCGYGGSSRLYAVNYKTALQADEDDQTVLTGVIGTSRYKTLGQGLPSEPVYYFDKVTKESKLFIQTSDSTLHEENINIGERPMIVNSWRTN